MLSEEEEGRLRLTRDDDSYGDFLKLFCKHKQFAENNWNYFSMMAWGIMMEALSSRPDQYREHIDQDVKGKIADEIFDLLCHAVHSYLKTGEDCDHEIYEGPDVFPFRMWIEAKGDGGGEIEIIWRADFHSGMVTTPSGWDAAAQRKSFGEERAARSQKK